MVLNIKNLFKKVCMISAAATMAVGLGASFAEAGTPGSNTTGSLIDGSVTIIKHSITDDEAKTDGTGLYQIVLNESPYTYNGQPYNIIKQITKDTTKIVGGGDTIKLYLRVADAQGDAPGDSGTGKEWKLYDSTKQSPLNDWQRTNTGTYYVYYYLDGGNNYNDYPATQNP